MKGLIKKIIQEHRGSIIETSKGNKEDFIRKAKQAHGNRYTYDNVDYQTAKKEVRITCPIHGDFSQTPDKHLSGQGCRQCAEEKRGERKRDSQEDFIAKAKQIHGNKFGYDDVKFKGYDEEVTINCPIHGKIKITPKVHLRGHGCYECGRIANKEKRTKPQEDFISQAILLWGDKYDYSKVDYQGADKNVTIVCPIHGDFQKKPYNHLSGQGCEKCSAEEISKRFRKPLDVFLSQARQVHGKKYNYKNVEYKNTDTPVEIICPNHGSFEQTPYAHINLRSGCPYCHESKGERMTSQVLDELGIKYKREYSFDDCLGKKCRRLYFDFYLPKYNTLIEYDGKQHFEPLPNREYEFEETLERDEIKNNYAKNNKIKLIRIPYTFNSPDLIKKELGKILKINKK